VASIYGTGWSGGQYLGQAGQVASIEYMLVRWPVSLEQSGQAASIYGTGWSSGQYLGLAGQVASI
jgi:hypothetical protein